MAEELKALQNQAKETAIDVRNEAIVQSANLYLLVRKLLLASLGALALTAEEGGEFLDRLVERGEVAEADVQKMLSEYRAGRKAPAKATQADKADKAAAKPAAKKASGPIEGGVESILDRLNVPTHGDIEELSKKISQLDSKIGELKAKKAEKELA
jgi:poly(hydroxyalkanoate) granule-associated protein